MDVFITGGTGFAGRNILRGLHTAGHRIHLLARNVHLPRTQEIAAQYEADVRGGNVLDAASLENVCAGVDAVIHLVGIIREVGNQTFENVHTRGTRNIVAATQQAGVKRFLHMSALGSRPNAVSRYHQSKWAAEEIVRQSGLDWTIFRPSIIYGPGDGFVNLFAKIIRRSPVVPIMGSGQSRFQPVPVEAVATAFVKALAEPRALGQIYDLCGQETLTLNEIVAQILAVMKRKRLTLHLPLAVARWQAAFLEFVFPRLLHKAPPLNRDQLSMLQEDNAGDAQPAKDLFGLKPASFREGIGKYVRRET